MNMTPVEREAVKRRLAEVNAAIQVHLDTDGPRDERIERWRTLTQEFSDLQEKLEIDR